MALTELRNCMIFKIVKQINLVESIKSLTKINYNLCMEEYLTILKNLRD